MQLVMRLCKAKRKGDDKLLFTTKERKAVEAQEAGDGADRDDFEGPESNGIDSITVMKKLVHAIGVIHNNQRAFWKDVNGSLQSIQGQVMSAQDRLRTIDSVVNSMVPHGMFCQCFCSIVQSLLLLLLPCLHLNLLYLSVMHFNQSLYILLPVYSH